MKKSHQGKKQKKRAKKRKPRKTKPEKSLAETRFQMVKERHQKTFEKAVQEGKADEKLIAFLQKVNASKDYFSSSSCAGRILFLALPGKKTKREAYFVARFHRPISFNEAWQTIQGFKKKESLWLKMEPFILHLGCRDLKPAEKILSVMRQTGVKRGGIMVTKKGKFMVELQGTEAMALPVKEKGKILLSEEFLRFLVEEANKKLEKNFKALTKFEKTFLQETSSG